MLSGKFWQRALSSVGVMLAVLALAATSFAQGTGVIRGTVTDEKGQPMQGAKITITRSGDSSARKWETTSDAKGEYLQAGLTYSGAYLVLCEKEKVGSDMAQASVKLGVRTTVNFQLIPGKLAPAQAAAQNKVLKQLFADGVAASQAGNHELAISKFNDMIAQMPKCSDCYYNIGVSQSQLKNWDAAEAAFKQAIVLRDDYVDAYNGLASVYNAERKMDLAAAAAAKASEMAAASGTGGGGGAETLTTQGVILWNAGKIPEATAQFEQAIKADATYAPPHYHYGMALLNQGKLPEALAEFDSYLKLAPSGEFAGQAKAMLSQLKK
jgi:tetratricopeptide (TPR) repeat protein